MQSVYSFVCSDSLVNVVFIIYLVQVGSKYADIVGEEAEVIIVRFFGIFFLFFQSTQVWGNLISSAGEI